MITSMKSSKYFTKKEQSTARITKTPNNDLLNILPNDYKYGFTTEIKNFTVPKGINQSIIEQLSEIKEEPTFLRKFRQQSLKKWEEIYLPTWANLKQLQIDFNDIVYYSAPTKKKK